MRIQLALIGTVLMAVPALATDGVVEINQTAATVGGVTPGDTAGFPVTVSVPGSYRLTGNLTVPNANTGAIRVTASDVTIDLNGFALIGPVSCTEADRVVTCAGTGIGTGILASSLTETNVTVLNGTVRGMGARGILISMDGSRIDGVRAMSNGGDGILVQEGSLVTNSLARLNGGDGIDLDASSAVAIGNTATKNGGDGFQVSWGALVRDNVAGRNGGDGIEVGQGATVVDNTVYDNLVVGLRLGGASGYRGNVIFSNDGGTVTGTGEEIGTNLCDGTTTCP